MYNLTEISNSKLNQYRFNGNNNQKIRYSFNEQKISLQNSHSSFNGILLEKYTKPKKHSESTIDYNKNSSKPQSVNKNDYKKNSCSFKKRQTNIDEEKNEENQQTEFNLREEIMKNCS